jgi:hypothetical protein
MAEIKNSFTSAKMNQDLDDRLIPSNEYREGRNISIISSDSSNAGSIENILGNELVADLVLGFDNYNFEIIGYIYNQTTSILYVMLTNYTDTSSNQLDNPQSYIQATSDPNTCSRIVQINLSPYLSTIEIKTLVNGTFLNFSKTHPITGINIIENLLFWTDNRNQPRKINTTTAYNYSNYYYDEVQISVAKYAPVAPIEFLNKGECTMRDVTSEFLPDDEPNPDYNPDYPGDPTYLSERFVRFSYRFRFDDGEYSIFAPFSQIAFIPQQDGSFITNGIISDENEAYRSSIVKFMKNKVNQIGLIMPLPTTGNELLGSFKITEIDILYKESDSLAIQVLDTVMAGDDSTGGFAYKPNELAGILGTGTNWSLYTPVIGNLNYGGYAHTVGSTNDLVTSLAATPSTVYQVNWIITDNTAGSISIKYGGVTLANKSISGVQSLTAVSNAVLLITPTSNFNGVIALSIIPKAGGILKPYISNTNNFYSYNYQSRKPKTTLPNDQLLRVYDKVPVRALAQETSGSRVIYGNYTDKHTPPNTIDYKVGINAKLVDGDIIKEYPLHTVKQNRNYQVGIILADKFGRQSDVILSSITDSQVTDGTFYGGSSFYSPYLGSDTNVITFFGNSIKVLFDSLITSDRDVLTDLTPNASGEPGLYDITGRLLKALIANQTVVPTLSAGTYTDIIVYNTNGDDSGARVTVTVNASSEVVDPIVITNNGYGGLSLGDELSLGEPVESTTILVDKISKENITGWYSYKIVVKQTQQEYYNVYIPGALSGYPVGADANTFPTDEDLKTSNIVFFSDNINKVPRDLSEVGPDQKQYRSSVRLFGRVQNDSAASNTQFIPSKKGFTVPALANASDLKMGVANIDTASVSNFYQLNTNPIIGRVSTGGVQFGVTTATMAPYLAILETDPVTSNLDLYWETSSTGLISELNELIGENITGAYSFIDVNYKQFEWQDPNGTDDINTGDKDCKYVTDWFYPVTYTNSTLYNTTAILTGVTNANGLPVSGFALESDTQDGINKYRIKITTNFYYNTAPNLSIFKFILAVTDAVSSTTSNVTLKEDLFNIAPTIVKYDLNTIYSGVPVGWPITIDTPGTTPYGINGSFGNIPASPPFTSTTTSELKWTFLDGTQIYTAGTGADAFTISLNANTGNLVLSSGYPLTVATPTIVLTDSGGAVDTLPLILDFTPGEFNPKEFTQEFNL